MAEQTLEGRKQYIDKVKASFQNPNESNRYCDINSTMSVEHTAAVPGLLKWRLWLAIILFAVFVYCDVNQVKIDGYTTENVSQQIEKNIYIEKIVQSIKNML